MKDTFKPCKQGHRVYWVDCKDCDTARAEGAQKMVEVITAKELLEEHIDAQFCSDWLKQQMHRLFAEKRAHAERALEVEGAFKACLKFMEGVQFHTSREVEDFMKLLPYWRRVASGQAVCTSCDGTGILKSDKLVFVACHCKDSQQDASKEAPKDNKSAGDVTSTSKPVLCTDCGDELLFKSPYPGGRCLDCHHKTRPVSTTDAALEPKEKK